MQDNSSVFYPDYSGHPLETIQELSPYHSNHHHQAHHPSTMMKTISHPPPHNIDPSARRNYYFAPLPVPTDAPSLPSVRSRGDYGATYPLLTNRHDDSITPSPPPSSGSASRHSITSSVTSSRSRRSPGEKYYLSLGKSDNEYTRNGPLLSGSTSSSTSGANRCDEAHLKSVDETKKIVKDIDALLANN